MTAGGDRDQHLRVLVNDVEIEHLVGTVDLLANAQSRATFTLPPGDTDAVELSIDDVYDVYKTEKDNVGADVLSLLMKGATPVVNECSHLFVPYGLNQAGEVRRTRTLVLQDRLWAYADTAPGPPVGSAPDIEDPTGNNFAVTHTDTDSHAELRFVAGIFGAPGAATNCPPVKIARIDYTRDGGYWGPLAPYFAPWGAQVFVEPSSGFFRVLDTTQYDASMTRAQSALTEDDVNDFKPKATRNIVPTQFRVNYLQFSGDDAAVKRDVVFRRDNEQRLPQDDGSVIVSWDWVADLYENPDDATMVTRSVPAGSGQTHVDADHNEILEQSTKILYEADYIRPRETTTTTKARVTFPGSATELFRQVETIVEKTTYAPHPTLPARYILVRIEKTTSGIYVYPYTGNDVADKRAGTPILQAKLAGTVSTESTTAQRWDEGDLRVHLDEYRRTGGAGIVTQDSTEIDKLRDVAVTVSHRMNVGDITVGSDGFGAYVYRGVAGTRAQEIDASKIGFDLGVELATARLARTGTLRRDVTFKMARAEYAKYRLGWVVTLAADALFQGFAGPYLCTGIHFTENASNSGQPGLVETMDLAREW